MSVDMRMLELEQRRNVFLSEPYEQFVAEIKAKIAKHGFNVDYFDEVHELFRSSRIANKHGKRPLTDRYCRLTNAADLFTLAPDTGPD